MRKYLPTNLLVHKHIQTDSNKKIVFLSGLGLNIRRQREAFLRRYALNQGVSYLALDYTKYTESSLNEPDYNLGKTFSQTMEILNKDDKKLFLFGACYGGLMALKIASQLPQRVHSVIAFSPPMETPEYPWVDQTISFLGKRIRDLTCKKVNPDILQKMILFREMIKIAFGSQGTDSISPNFHGPVHIFHGQKDKLIPAENSIYVQKALNNPNCIVHITPNTGHTMNNDFEMKIPIRILNEYLMRS